jgi:Ca2+-binding EF-hand superfamily protein
MIHLIQPPTHDEVILPKSSTTTSNNNNNNHTKKKDETVSTLEDDDLYSGGGLNRASSSSSLSSSNNNRQLQQQQEDALMQLRLSRSQRLVTAEARARARSGLDPTAIAHWMNKMQNVMETHTLDASSTNMMGTTSTLTVSNSLLGVGRSAQHKSSSSSSSLKQKKKDKLISPIMVANLEKKLANAIKGKYNSRLKKLKKQRQQSMFINSDNNNNNNHTGTNVTSTNNNNNTNNNAAPPIVPILSSNYSVSGMNSLALSDDSLDDDNNSNNNNNNNTHGINLPPIITSNNNNNNNNNNEDDPLNNNNNNIYLLPSPTKAKPPVTLTTRDILPYYKLDTVLQFMDIFAKVDENFSGDLDVHEWIRLFTSLNESVPVQEARMIFMKIDKDNDGFLSMRELIPVIFNKANKLQQRKIIEFCEFELIKKIDNETIPTITNTDLEFLFEAYDMDNVGFVDVSVIRERIRRLNTQFGYLNETHIYFFMELICDLEDDEMVNLTEFKRMFKLFSSSK